MELCAERRPWAHQARSTDGTSNVVIATYRTDEFGVPTASTGSSGQPFGFTGEPSDGTGLSYLRARYYDPSLGRFMSRDPWPGSVGAPQSLDRYCYVANNPATATDPSGLVLKIRDFLPCDPASFFLGLGLLAGGSFRAAVGITALGATGGASILPSLIAITTGAATAAAGARFIWHGYHCPSTFP